MTGRPIDLIPGRSAEVARKKPGKKTKARKKAARKATRTSGSARKSKARTKPAKKKKKKPATRAARKKTSAKKKTAARKSKKKVKRTTAAKSGSAKKSAAKKTSARPSPRTTKKAGSSAKTGKVTKAQAKASKAETSKKGAGKKAEERAGPVPDAQGYVVINGRRVRMISTKGLTIPKRSATRAAAAKEEAKDAPKKPRKSRLTPKDLEYYRDLLLLRRRQAAGDLTSMESEALRSGGGSVSHMPIHMADIGSDTFDQDFMLGLAANERDLLKEIDDALERIENGQYGICALTGNPIPKSRLNAKPWAKYTVEAARMIERGISA